MFNKLGEAAEIRLESSDSCIPQVNPAILDNFQKFANSLKKIAPKADDFLYFSAVMMHAAEAAGINDDGTPRMTARGEQVEVGWDQSDGTWKWKTNDKNIKPYKNSNGDIFPELELVKAYKKWVGKPLCIDHKSSSVDHVRGFIVDTYYDRNLKRVIALCALDKAGYPQLARQVSTGVSNCVSMGTAVGRAICTDCARVARTEQDFCQHMKNKSCYGEINVDLNPIELSIVVNGADPKANIKHIIAAANTLNNYVETKQNELNKLAETFTANFSFSSGTPEEMNNSGGVATNVSISAKTIEQFTKEIDNAISKFKDLKSQAENEEKVQTHGNDIAFNELEDIEQSPTADSGTAPPHARFASAEVGVDTLTELHEVVKTIEAKLGQMKENLDKLANTSTQKKQEENMSGTNIKQGYYQGAGGVNEPTPGQAKYTKDPMQENLREKEDRQMVGQSPFPGVGDINNGLHPSPSSADESNELERKKMLARAEAEERATRRQAIVNLAKDALQSKAYHQGGGGVNEPAMGEVKYPIDKLNEQLRAREDKQMVGQKPFPGVGAVDGLHPSPVSSDTSDELKRKEMLRRASLRAKFSKVANFDGTTDLNRSSWEVYRGDELILTASVADLSGGRSEVMFDSIATKDFGSKLLEKVKAHGADKVNSLIKKAQAAPSAPLATPAPEAPPSADAPPAEDTGKSGDPKEVAVELAEKVRDLSSDLLEAVRALTGEQAEMGSEMTPVGEPGEMAAAASFSTKSLNNLRKDLNGALVTAMKESIATLNDHAEELDMLSSLDMNSVNDANKELAMTVAQDAVTEAKTAIADGFQLMTAFVKYARGTKAIVKRAEIEAELEALAEGDTMTDEHNADGDLLAMIDSNNSDLNDMRELMSKDEGHEGHEDSSGELADLLRDMEENHVDDNDATLTVKPGEKVPAGVTPETEVHVTASLNTKEGRAALRAKLASDATGKQEDGEIQDMSKAKFFDILNDANSLANGLTHLDVKVTDDRARVQTLPEQNKFMMDLAKAPPKVRKEAEAIHQLVSEGKLDVSDLDALVAEGLDKDAVSYYKKFYGQTDGGSEFASELVKEHVKAEMEKELNSFKVKMARAYEMTYDMVSRGLVAHDRNVIAAHVDELMEFNEANFETLKRVVAKHEVLGKTAGRLPQVGLIGSVEVSSLVSEEDDFSQLSAAFAKNSKRTF
jgi:hypothetical protein